MDAAPCCFIQDSPTLRDLNGLGDLLLRLHLRHGDGQDAVLHLGRDLVFHDIIRQRGSRWDRFLGMTAAMTSVPVPTASGIYCIPL